MLQITVVMVCYKRKFNVIRVIDTFLPSVDVKVRDNRIDYTYQSAAR